MSDTNIKVYKKVNLNLKKPKHYKLFREPYPNIFICARKKSGKTILIQNIINKSYGENTKVLIISSSHDRDGQYASIKKMMDKLNIIYHCTKDINFLEHIINSEDNNNTDTNENNVITTSYMNFNKAKKIIKKKKEEKYIKPKYVIIIDDMGRSITRNNILDKFLKTNRHYKAMIVISSQYIKDLQPSMLNNLDYLLLYKIPDNKDILKHIYMNINISDDFETFKLMYDEATKKKYSFLYIDINNSLYRINFNKSIRKIK